MARSSEPSAFGLVVATLFALVLGAALGLGNLAIKPAEVVTELPEEEERDPRVNYVIRGSLGGGGSYRGKETAMANGNAGTYTFTEAELNTWARNNFRPRPTDDEEEDGLAVTVEPPDFRIVEDRLQIVAGIQAGAGEESAVTLYEAIGTFQSGPGGLTFVPDEAYLASARLPLALAPAVQSFLLSQYREAETFDEAANLFSGIRAVSIEDGQLVLQFQPR